MSYSLGCWCITEKPSLSSQANHPNPGVPYLRLDRKAYLPNNRQGQKVARLLTRAFDAGLIFAIGTSASGPNAVIFNGIEHKTRIRGP